MNDIDDNCVGNININLLKDVFSYASDNVMLTGHSFGGATVLDL